MRTAASAGRVAPDGAAVVVVSNFSIKEIHAFDEVPK
jgi:hypothetical protein